MVGGLNCCLQCAYSRLVCSALVSQTALLLPHMLTQHLVLMLLLLLPPSHLSGKELLPVGSSSGEYRSRLSLLAGTHLQGVPPTLQVRAPCRDTPTHTQVLPCPCFMCRHTPLCVVCVVRTHNLRQIQRCVNNTATTQAAGSGQHSINTTATVCVRLHAAACMSVTACWSHAAACTLLLRLECRRPAAPTYIHTCLSANSAACMCCLSMQPPCQHTCLCGMTQSYK